MGFELVKLAGGLLMPMPLILILLAAGSIMLAAARPRKFAAVLLAAGIVSLLLLSLPQVPEHMLGSLENDYTVLRDPPAAEWIMVLGGGSKYEKDLPAAACLGESSLYRLAEGVRLAKLLPEAGLITSGGDPGSSYPSTAGLMAETASGWGIERSRITALEKPRNTAAEARAAADLIRSGDRVILVTSAFHMRRAEALFRGQGVNAIPAPAGHQVDKNRKERHIGHQLPQADYLEFAETALWEYLGLIWAKIRGDLKNQD